ncbi:hypothetical protein JZ785_27110 [Alicyclobacillus curvatus]|nr:hypothetical protein JZ785_27110 [Alicyclobacillus curvatus]
MRPIQLHGLRYDYRSKGIAEFVMEDRVPDASADKFGLGIKIPTLISVDTSNATTIRATECKVFLKQWDTPIRVGQCDMSFAGGHRREINLANPHNAMTMYLNVFFLRHELVLLEQQRQHGDLRLQFEVKFTFVVDSDEGIPSPEISGFGYIDDYTIAKSDWENILRKSDYLMGESLSVSEMLSNDASWSQALTTLQDARHRLNSGDGMGALDSVDQALKRFVKYPYNGLQAWGRHDQDCWREYIESNFPSIEQPKIEAIAQLMGGLGGYLNKTSHHKEDINTPTSHYEHELIVTTAQLLLTYLYRLGITERHNLPTQTEERSQ